MTPDETRALAQALVHADHRFLGVRPLDADPTEAPCFVMAEPTFGSFQYALQTAGEYWTDCTQWALIGSDEQLAIRSDDWPPRLFALRMPVTLTTFTTP